MNTAKNGSGDFRDRCLAAAISAALHVFAVAWMWCVSARTGGGQSDEQGRHAGDRISISFIAPDELRQRTDTKPPLVSSTAIPATDVSRKSELGTPAEPTVDLPDRMTRADPIAYPASDATVVEGNKAIQNETIRTGLNQGGDNDRSSHENGLRAAYLAAIRAAIHQHWNYQGAPQQCSLTIKQSPGGTVKSAIAGECSLTTQDRRALEAAALMAQPLPYAGFEDVYLDSVALDIVEL